MSNNEAETLQEYLAETNKYGPAAEHMAINLHIERIKRGDIIDDDGEFRTAEEMRADKPIREAKMRHAERGAQERKLLHGLAVREPGSAPLPTGKTIEGYKWSKEVYHYEGQVLIERPWHEHAAFAESVRQQNKFVRAEEALRGCKGVEEAGYLPPEIEAPAYTTPKAAAGFAVASKKSRISKTEMPKARTLLGISNAIRAALAKKDKAGAGALLAEAKEIVGHGRFVEWAERETGLSARTVQRVMVETGVVKSNTTQA